MWFLRENVVQISVCELRFCLYVATQTSLGVMYEL